MSMAFIKLVYETSAARAFKRHEDITISDDDLVKGFEQAKGYYTQMEIPDDRNAGFAAKKKSSLKSDDEAKEEPTEERKSYNKEQPIETGPHEARPTVHAYPGINT